jgi:hypothetical protein
MRTPVRAAGGSSLLSGAVIALVLGEKSSGTRGPCVPKWRCIGREARFSDFQRIRKAYDVKAHHRKRKSNRPSAVSEARKTALLVAFVAVVGQIANAVLTGLFSLLTAVVSSHH